MSARSARHPEQGLVVLAVAGWCVLLVLPLVPAGGHGHGALGGQVLGGHALGVHAVGALGMLLVMAPLVGPNARFAALRSPRARRTAAVVAVAGGWAAVWLVGLLVLGAVVLALQPLGTVLPLVALTAVAALWQLAPAKRRGLARCHRVLAPPLDRVAGRRACRRHGVDVGWGCWVSCAPMMALMTAAGHGPLVVAPLTAVAWYERRRRPHHDPGGRPTALVVAAVGVLAVSVAALGLGPLNP